MKTYLSKEKLAEMLNEEEIAVYIALKIIYDQMLTNDKDYVEVVCNIYELYYELSGSFNMNKTDKYKIEKGLNDLINGGIIELINKDKENYVLNISNLHIDSKRIEPYTTMDRQEIRNIMNIQHKQRYNVLRFTVNLFGTINNTYKCGFSSIKTLQNLSCISNKTVVELFKVLENNKIIYVCHSNMAKRDKDGKIKQLSNVYGRPEDKKDIYKYYINRLNKEGFDFTKEMSSKRKAQVTRNYTKFINGNYTGNIIELIKECLFYNKLPYVKQKDLSVFDKRQVIEAKDNLEEYIRKNKEERNIREEYIYNDMNVVDADCIF